MVAIAGSGFDATAFRDAVKFVMKMGTPLADSDKTTFIFPEVIQYPPGTIVDIDGNPMDPTVAPTITRPPSVTLECAVEYSTPSFGGVPAYDLPVGFVRRILATITVLDVDYPSVKDASQVLIGGDLYLINYWQAPFTLFDAAVYQCLCMSKEEK